MYLYAYSTTQSCLKEIRKMFLIEDFQFATGVNDTGGAPWAANISATFRKNSKRLQFQIWTNLTPIPNQRHPPPPHQGGDRSVNTFVNVSGQYLPNVMYIMEYSGAWGKLIHKKTEVENLVTLSL